MMYNVFTQQLFATEHSWTGFILRFTLGVVLFPHAAQKMFGWFNGPGLSGEMEHMTHAIGLSVPVAVLSILVECLGTLLLLTGFATRIAAVGMFGLFVGMIVFVHFKSGYFMNWFGKMPAGHEGFEYHLLVLGLCILIFMHGGGRYSIDGLLTR
ncbi:DoxX family protein [Chitinophaga defluvii]|uniref:DoxX family protein n=1 Tax=Chitinophaga defluvii TaxID=3163343 RepID=A0ABV2TET6_9BACT